jgi:hypothetical protein
MFSPGPEWTISGIVARWLAQVCALAASESLHTSGGTPTAARSLLCTARMLLAQSALIVPVLVAGGGIAAGGGVSVAGGASAVSPSPAGGGVCISPSPAGGASVGQLPLASGVEPSGHNCEYEGPAGGSSVGQLPLASGVEPSGHNCEYEGPAGGSSVGQLPLASGVEPSGHNCEYEGCSIDDGDCTVRIADVTRITLIIIDSLPFMFVGLISSICLITYRMIYILALLAKQTKEFHPYRSKLTQLTSQN